MSNNKLFVGNLAYSITEQQLNESFAQAGAVRSVRVALDRETQRPRGFAFVEMETEADADAVIKAWNTQMLLGRALHIEKAQERPPGPRPPRPGFGSAPRPIGVGGGPPPGGGGWSPRPPFAGAGAAGGRFSPPPVTKDDGRRQRAKQPDRKAAAEKRRSGRPEQRERGKWHWDGTEEH